MSVELEKFFPCHGPCGRMTRPGGVKLSQVPEAVGKTVIRATATKCGKCTYAENEAIRLSARARSRQRDQDLRARAAELDEKDKATLDSVNAWMEARRRRLRRAA